MNMSTNTYSLLETVNDPADMRKLSRAQLKTLAAELRIVYANDTLGELEPCG